MPLLKIPTSFSEPLAGLPDEDDGMVEAVSSDLILIEGDEDGLSGSGEDRDKEEQVTFHLGHRGKRQKPSALSSPFAWTKYAKIQYMNLSFSKQRENMLMTPGPSS